MCLTLRINISSLSKRSQGLNKRLAATDLSEFPSPKLNIYKVKHFDVSVAGTATAVVTGIGSYTDSVGVKFKINKAKNTLNSKAKTVKIKYSDVKDKKVTIKQQKAFSISKPQGKLTYDKKSGNKNIGVNKKNGNIVVKKGLKKGTYKVKVKINAAGNKNYKTKTKTVTVKIKIE